MKNILISIIFLSLSCLAAKGQIKVQGTVVDALSEPLVGVNIVEKGTTNGVITDINGTYTITVANSNSELTF